MGGNRRSIETLGTSSTFLHDLGLSARALVAAPLLVVISVGLAVATAASGGFVPLQLLFQLCLAGFVGVQRVWFFRVWRGSALELHEIAPFVWRFLGRYVALGFVAGIVFCVPLLTANALFGADNRGAVIAVGIVLGVLSDVWLTFVTPALAYTTGSVRRALGIGTRMLGTTWPRSAGYALTPGLVLASFGYLLPQRLASIPLAAVGAVVAVWFKGAVAAFYLRLHPETDGFGA